MKIVIALTFIVLAIPMIGLFFVNRVNFYGLNSSSKYWSIAIVCDALGLALMGTLFITIPDFTQTNFTGTIANTLLFASLLYQTASIRAIQSDITLKQQGQIFGAVAVFAVVWNYLRLNIDTKPRIFFFALLALVILIWQLYEIKRHSKRSSQLQIASYSVIAEILFVALRALAIGGVGSSIMSVEELPVVGLFAMWVQYGLKTVVYGALIAYWSEHLATKNAQVEFENNQFKALSERQERLIEDLGRLNKAATVGVLAASIAHELSQPLQSTILNATSSLDEAQKPAPDVDFLIDLLKDQIENAHRMAQVMHTMRGVFTEAGAKEAVVDLYDLVQDLALLITPQAQQFGIEMVYERTQACRVYVRVSEIQQVVLNVLGNAIDALTEAKTPHPVVKIICGTDGLWAVCRIEDNGPGMPDGNYDDVFKFLKSSKDSGMGLGLWLSKYIVERHGGQIEAKQGRLGGAAFTLKFQIHGSTEGLVRVS